MNRYPAPRLLATTDEVVAALRSCADAPWVGVDTEFMRERTYYPQLCLIQLATATGGFAIDTIAVSDYSALGEFLTAPHRVKVLHAARQDLEALARIGLMVTAPLFDCQIAAGLLGHSEQVSYAWLVQQYFQIGLDKSLTRTNWAQRPLDDAQLQYALADVQYLGPLYERLAADLAEGEKLSWLWEEGERLLESANRTESPQDIFRRVHGTQRLQGVALARAWALAQWREETARLINCPRGWLLKDEAIVALASNPALDERSLAQIEGLPPATIRRHGMALIQLTQNAAGISSPVPDEAGVPLDASQKERLKALQAALKTLAEAHALAPGMIANRKELEAWISGRGKATRLRSGWRHQLLTPLFKLFGDLQ